MKFCFIESEPNSYINTFNNFKITYRISRYMLDQIVLLCLADNIKSHVSSIVVVHILWEYSFFMTVLNILLITTLQSKTHLNIQGTKLLSHLPDLAQYLLLYVVNKGLCVKYKWSENLLRWISPFIIKWPVLILRSESLNLSICSQFWDCQDCCLW